MFLISDRVGTTSENRIYPLKTILTPPPHCFYSVNQWGAAICRGPAPFTIKAMTEIIIAVSERQVQPVASAGGGDSASYG